MDVKSTIMDLESILFIDHKFNLVKENYMIIPISEGGVIVRVGD